MSAHILIQVAHAAGYVADHVNYLSLGGLKDWQLLPVIREREFTFVTNNSADFLALFGKEPLHPGIIIIVPNVTPVHFLDRKKSCFPIRCCELSGEWKLNPIYSWINAHRLLGS